MPTWADSKARERRGTLRVTLGLLLIAIAGILPLAVRCAAQAFLQADKAPLTLLSQRIYLNLGFQIDGWLRWWPVASFVLLGLGFRLLRRGVQQWKPLPMAVNAPEEAPLSYAPEPMPALKPKAKSMPKSKPKPKAKPKPKPKPKAKPKAKPRPKAKRKR